MRSRRCAWTAAAPMSDHARARTHTRTQSMGVLWDSVISSCAVVSCVVLHKTSLFFIVLMLQALCMCLCVFVVARLPGLLCLLSQADLWISYAGVAAERAS